MSRACSKGKVATEREAAQTAFQAALVGRPVRSTLHRQLSGF
jgi:hypothetical protein